MGIRFFCPACSKKVHVKQQQAGLRGFCPKCGEKIEIPLQSTRESSKKRRRPESNEAAADLAPRTNSELSPANDRESTLNLMLPRTGRLLSVSQTAPVDPLDSEPKMQWYVVPPNGTEPFGPADASAMRRWIAEGRVGVQSLVWREDWPEWRKAGTVWSYLVVEQARQAAAEAKR